MSDAGLQVRKLGKNDEGGRSLAVAAGLHGVYVQNALAEGLHDGLVFILDGIECGMAWFGPRGNLVLLTDERLHGLDQQIAEHIRASRWAWRIILGPQDVVDTLATGLARPPLAHRDQIYYVGGSEDAKRALVRDDMRAPVGEDRERLARATLALNASDLNIAPARVDRRWLYRMIDERIEDGSTRVLGPIGGLWSKLDYGTDGPGGAVLEGVFTFPDRRGRGLGAELVATCMAEAIMPLSLHVADHNRSARSAYERAGMREAGSCRLLLQS
ncbi:MAG: GNAT superfamily N-acetyltransferase [Planctomycetota bacterium]|jgi:GNAT superfamily N-acetyltransferase